MGIDANGSAAIAAAKLPGNAYDIGTRGSVTASSSVPEHQDEAECREDIQKGYELQGLAWYVLTLLPSMQQGQTTVEMERMLHIKMCQLYIFAGMKRSQPRQGETVVQLASRIATYCDLVLPIALLGAKQKLAALVRGIPPP